MNLSGLIQRYVESGHTRSQAIWIVHLSSGVSVSSIRAVLDGHQVLMASAWKLAEWARNTHRVELDVVKMMAAPPRRKQ